MKKLVNILLFAMFKGGLISLFLSLIRVKLGFWSVLVMLVYLIASELDKLKWKYEIKDYIFRAGRKHNGTINK